MINSFNPFKKNCSDIQTTDLEVLKSVHEGWFTEYKSGPITTKAYAKSISAMANTYGGWIVIGAKEFSKDNNVVGSFPGISNISADSEMQRIRQAVAEHLHPSPYFEICRVPAPEAEDSLTVICIHVPASQQAPIVHSDGRIYKRINDSSEPVPENRRDAVEHLIDRSNKLRRYYEHWFDSDPSLSRGEEDLPYIRMIACSDYWQERSIYLFDEDEEIVNNINAVGEGIHFSKQYNNFFSSAKGIVCRSINSDNPRGFCSTLMINYDLSSEIITPLHSIGLEEYGAFGDIHLDIASFLADSGYENASLINFDDVFGVIDSYLALMKRFQRKLNYYDNTHVKFQLVNVWRTIPVLGIPVSDLGWDTYGIPIIMDNIVQSPSDGDISTFIPVNLHTSKSLDNPYFLLATKPFARILRSIGLGARNSDKFNRLIDSAILRSYDRASKTKTETK